MTVSFKKEQNKTQASDMIPPNNEYVPTEVLNEVNHFSPTSQQPIIEMKPNRTSKAADPNQFYPVTDPSMKVLKYSVKYEVRCDLRLHSVYYEMKVTGNAKNMGEKNGRGYIHVPEVTLTFSKQMGTWFYHILKLEGLSSDTSGCDYRFIFCDELAIPVGHTQFMTLKSSHTISSNPEGYLWAESTISKDRKASADHQSKPATKRKKVTKRPTDDK